MTTSRVAIIGAGPSGLYTAKSLLDCAETEGLELQIDVLDRLEVPFGLLRYGVAPDHKSFAKIQTILGEVLADPRVSFRGGMELGVTTSREQLVAEYDAVVYAVGAPKDTALGVPGEELEGSMPASRLVRWYNGHPEAQDTSIHGVTSLAVVGVGNVALDIARLLTAPAGYLAETHTPAEVQAHLDAADVRDLWIFARRGPQHAAFTTPELKELTHLPDVAVVLHGMTRADMEALAEAAVAEGADRRVRGNLTTMATKAVESDSPEAAAAKRRVHLAFWRKPVEILGTDGRVSGLVLERTELVDGKVVGTGEQETIDAQVVVAAVGNRGVQLPGVPFDERWGVIANRDGLVVDGPDGAVQPGEFVVGWAKRGATGIIGNCKSDGNEACVQILGHIKGNA